ncbi:MAG: gamma-glutamyl-gamma-aminobutyrate hydrolase family protein [Novosphingobium sp.]|nr:gamma-glutamyl-gamma-aminobutyrate hydrolase family protein [Novosphingobium sp.]
MPRIVIVRHDTETPSLYGAAAALVAAREGGRVFWPETKFDLSRYPDAVQHVTEDGALVPSGLIWTERLGLEAARPLAEMGLWSGCAVIPWHPAFESDSSTVERLVEDGAKLRTVRLEGGKFVDWTRGEPGEVIGWRDRFGRVMAGEPGEDSPKERSGLVFVIAGPEKQFTDVCPAPLAALADAIDSEAPGSDIRFVDPRQFSAQDFDGVDGLLLPGGSEMSAVAGQVEMARVARETGLPVLGLCLGMQSMCTAVARELPGWEDADMEEAAPASARHSFVRIETGEYRLGRRSARIASGTWLSRILGNETSILCNHRYRLVPELHEALATREVTVSALGGGPGQNIADAIEGQGGFYAGLQGHPELSSYPGKPHPVIREFVAETRRQASQDNH